MKTSELIKHLETLKELVQNSYNEKNYSNAEIKKLEKAISELEYLVIKNKNYNEFLLNKALPDYFGDIISSEELYRTAIDKTGQVIYSYSSSDRKMSLFGAVRKLTGYTEEEFNFLKDPDFINHIHPDDKKTYKIKRDEAINNLRSFYLEYRFKKKNGSYMYIQDRAECLPDSKGKVMLIGAIADISTRKFAESLLQSQERTNRILKDIAIKTNQAPSIYDVFNAALSIISSYTFWPAGHVIMIDNKILPGHLSSIWYSTNNKYNLLMKVYEETDIYKCPIHMQLIKEKKTQWIINLGDNEDYPFSDLALKSGINSLIIFPVFMSGEVVGMIEFFSEQKVIADENMPYVMEQIGAQLGIVLARKLADEELLKLSKAIEQGPALVTISDTEGVIEYVNNKFIKVTGYTPEEAIGKKHNILKSGVHPRSFYKDLWTVVKSGESWEGELCNRKKDGTFYWEKVNISPIKNSTGTITHFVSVREDITEKKKSEAELKLAKEAAELANRAKSEFLANMSHEIRTPMNSILGFTELLRTLVTDEREQSYVDSIKSSGKSLLTIINDVLDLSKVEAGRMVIHKDLIDPFMFFKDIEYLFSLKAKEKGLDFSIELDGKMPLGIEIDEVRLRQILINLIGNALKFTDNGYVKVYVECIDEKHLGNDNFVDLQFVVKDSGIGISKDFINNLFKPFTQQESQSTKKYGGTGLGLSITKRLVELFNGTISVESESGKGSCFKVVLTGIKTTRSKIDTTEISTIDPRRIHFEKASVIIADDVENNRKYLASVLQDTGIEIIESHDGMETFELAMIKKPDLIITDLKMPVYNGFELLEKLRKNDTTKNIPVIATSASTSINESDKVFIHNFNGILIKPIHINDVFLELIRFLPHTISEETVSSNKQADALTKKVLSAEQIKEIRPILEKELFLLWETFKDQQPLADVEAFAYKIKEAGKLHNVEMLETYGNRLISSINSFDIASMLKILKQYPNIVQNILKD